MRAGFLLRTVLGACSIAFIPCASFVVAAPVSQQCTPIPGAEKLIRNRNLRWIIVGEMHGTNETPSAFLDLVCEASKRHPVIVAVEQSAAAQTAIDEFISSDGSPAARAAFLKSPVWTQEMKDGRSSEAYFRLFEALRKMKAGGQVKRVVAIAPDSYPGPAAYEQLMSNELRSKSDQGYRVLVLVGNLHARLTPFPQANSYTPMAGHLPPNEIATLDARPSGGAMWACMMGGCGPHRLEGAELGTTRKIVLDQKVDGYTGVLILGVPATASLPQKAD